MNKKYFIAAMAAAALILVLSYNYCNIKTRNAVERLIKDNKMINILIAGSNQYNKNRHRFFSLVSINPVNNKIGITFIPPGYRIRVGGDEYAKIEDVDFIYFDKIRDTLKDDLKLNVPFYVKIYADNVIRAVDLFEGIDLFVLDQIKDKAHLHFGTNYFDGKRIMRYINSVPENSIYLKYDRVLDVLLSLYDKKNEYEQLHNIQFIRELFRSINTNLLPQEAYEIGKIIYEDGDMIATLLPGGFEKEYYVIDDLSYKIYEKEFLQSVILDKIKEPPVKVKLLNGTDVPGLARKMRNILIRDGITVVEFGTSPYENMEQSIIINKKCNYNSVKQISELTGINHIYHVIDNTELYNIMIIIGKDYIK